MEEWAACVLTLIVLARNIAAERVEYRRVAGVGCIGSVNPRDPDLFSERKPAWVNRPEEALPVPAEDFTPRSRLPLQRCRLQQNCGARHIARNSEPTLPGS